MEDEKKEMMYETLNIWDKQFTHKCRLLANFKRTQKCIKMKV